MGQIYFTEVIERIVEVVEGRPSGKEKKIITRYYTEFDPDPLTVLDKFTASQVGESMPSIFYEIEDIAETLNGKYKTIPLSVGIKPLSIVIDQGNWGDRVDWTVQWETLDETQIQAPLSILGLEIFDWQKTMQVGEVASEHLFGHKIFDTSDDSAGSFSKLRTTKPRYHITGKVVGEIDYDNLRAQIKLDTSIVGFEYAYNQVTNITTLDIQQEESVEKDNENV